MSGKFAHLHCHTTFSMLDGATKLKDLIKKCKANDMNAVAVTDHGNLCGAFEFYNMCRDEGLNPIVGYEAYIAPGSRFDRTGASRQKEAAYHLTLLASSATGYFNLIKLTSKAYLEGFYYKPRIDKQLLEECNEGIICLSGCAAGELSQLLLQDRHDEAEKLVEWYSRVFGDRFYMEIQNAGLDIQKQCMDMTVDLARKKGLPLVATNDAHYLNREDAEAHDVLLCVSTLSQRSDPNRMRMTSDQFYVRTPAEMYEAFPGFEEAVAMSQVIAERCDIQLEKKPKHYPVFKPPGDMTDTQYLRKLCEDALPTRYDEVTDAIRARLDLELKVIEKMGYSSYFLIVWDFVRFAKETDIPCGARGSACGAMVAFLLGMSNVCPLKYDLLFERFLDESRTEPPDIDIDFCRDGRQRVIDYTKEKYGHDSVCQIGTFGTLKAKAAVRDVARALGYTPTETNEIAKLVPDDLGIKVKEAIEQNPELQTKYDSDPKIKELFDFAMKLEGLCRSAGTHAAGVVVGDGPVIRYLPLQTISGKTDVITQWDGPHVEKAGLLKMDFLGLRNLTILHKAVQNVEKHRGLKLDVLKFPLDDPQTFALLQRGETKGIFQFEGGGIRDLLTKMKPDKFADVIATSALYRPGPLEGGMVMEYVDVKHGRREPTKVHPVVDEILAETYGVMCIHEDVRVSLADGSEKPIKFVKRGDRVHSLNYDSSRFDIKECHGCGPTRRGEGLRITLENGFCVTLTPDHKVYTFDGWKEAQELDVERDIVATGMRLTQEFHYDDALAPWLGSNEDVAYLLGYLVGDGCLTGKGLSAATGTKDNHDRLVAWLRERLPKLSVNEYFHMRCWYVALSCSELLNDESHGNRKTKLHHLLESLGLKTTAHHKHVPTVILSSAPSVRAAFLAGLLDSDGCFAENSKGSGVCFFSTVSNRLLEDMRRLCQLEGIPVMMRRNRIHLWNLERLHEVVGERLVIKEIVGKRTTGETVGWVPRQRVLATVPAGESQRAFEQRTGINRRSLKHDFPFVKSSTAAKAGIDLGDVRYFRITAIERVADQQFYGMSVADHHNLVANGVVVKNCYQEQVMRILNRVGGIELANAYKCIKAISKKKLETIAKFRDEYVKGAQERGIDVDVAVRLFELIEKFAGYGFNKSHSTAYGLVSYQTAYLKAHYKVEFMAALLSCGMEDSDRMTEHTDDSRRLGVPVEPPDVNKSDVEFTVEGDRVRYGLGAIKGLGLEAMTALVEARRKHGPFKSIFDIAERVDSKWMSKTILETLIAAGCLDSLGPNRAQHQQAIDRAMQSASSKAKDKARGQKSLFGGDDETDAKTGEKTEATVELPPAEDWSYAQKLAAEKEVFGFYLTSHPLTQVGDRLERLVNTKNKELGTMDDGTDVIIGGMISSIKPASTKKPSRNGHTKYANFDFEDSTGIVRCIIWPEDYARDGEKVKKDTIAIIKGRVDRRGREPNVIVNQLLTLEDAEKQFTRHLAIKFRRGVHSDHDVARTREILGKYPGKTGVVVFVESQDPENSSARLLYTLMPEQDLKVTCNNELQEALTAVLGRDNFKFQAEVQKKKPAGSGQATGR